MPVSGLRRRRVRAVSCPRPDCPTIGYVMSRLARPVVLVPLVVVLVLIGVGAWWWTRAGSSTGVSAEQASREYGGSPPRSVAGAPQGGTWTYRARGDETVGLGPIELDRPLPDEAQVVVRPAPGGYWRTLVLSEQHVEASRFRVRTRGAFLEERITTVTVAGVGRDDRQVLVPAPLAWPRRIAVGDAWRERYVMDEVRVDTRVRVLRRTSIEVAGRRIPVLLVDRRGVVSGPLEGFRDDRMWWSPSMQMPVRWVLRTKLEGFASIRTDADLVMSGVEPAA